jgi:regulation of enolase protein 1 (concanavalin A-like superfamily)
MENLNLKALFIIVCLFFISFWAGAQTLLDDSGSMEIINVDNCCVGENYELSQGNAQDFTIPSDVTHNAISFTLRGGDGGFAKAGADCKRWGGDGATVQATFFIGSGADQLEPGGKIRFVVGKHGEDTDRGGTASGGGGGGGGTAVLYQPVNDNNWVILAVAGGGGGAHQGNLFGGCIDSQNGQGGRASEDGGDGEGDDHGDGGTGGNGGDPGPAGNFNDSGGGGGAYTSGNGGEIPIGTTNPFGYLSGDAGYSGGGFGGDEDPDNSDGFLGRGGFGFGGGGSGGGAAPGGGGGGYSGGGGGGKADNGGGGGSYVNEAYAYIHNKANGGNNSNSDHGHATYQFLDICTPEIDWIEELQGFCGTPPGAALAIIQVHLNNADNCSGNIIYQLFNASTNTSNTSGLFPILTPGTYYLALRVGLNGNSTVVDTETITITQADTRPPIARCKNKTIDLSTSSRVITNFEDQLDNGSTDNCGIASYAVSLSQFTCNNLGENGIILTVTDESGNSSTCVSVVTVVDVGAPVPDVANLPTISGECSVSITTTPTATDACEGEVIATTSDPLFYSEQGTYTITWTYVDSKGNTSTQNQTVVVDDVSAPTVSCPNDITVNASAGACSAKVNFIASASDNCDYQTDAVGYLHYGQNIPAGNDRLLIVQVTHFETVTGITYNGMAMTKILHQDANVAGTLDLWYLVLGSGDAINASAEVSGVGYNKRVEHISFVNVDQDNPIGDIDQVKNQNSVQVNTRQQDMIYEGFMRKDGGLTLPQSGQTLIFDRIFNLNSTTSWGSYKAGSGAIQNLNINSSNGAHAAVVVQAKHQINIDYSVDPGSAFQIGATQVTFTAMDKNNNSSNCAFNVTVNSSTHPNISCPADITVNNDAGDCNAVVIFDVSSTDNCTSTTLTQNEGLASGASFPVGTTLNTFTATNGAGLTANCSFNVTVNDNTAPTANCQNQTIALDATANATINATSIDNGSSDNCNIASQSLDNTAFTCTDVGANTVTLTVTDVNGNSSTCQATVTVEDNILPAALCQNHTVQLDANGAGAITTADIDNGSNDACGIDNLSLSKTNFSCIHVGGNIIFLTVTDNNGNSSTCQSLVVVEDNIAPLALCQDHTVQLDAAGSGSITTADIDNGSNDACPDGSVPGGIANLSLNNTSFDCANVGANTVTLTVTDNNGNSSNCQATVTVEDNVNPNSLCQNKTVPLDANGEGSISVADINNGSNDACGVANVALDNTSFGCADVGANAVTLTVTDNNGNSSSCQATVTVEDHIAPVASCQNHTVSLDAGGNGTISTTDIDNGSADACSIASLSLSNTSFACTGVGTHTVTLTVTDNNGNSSTCQSTVIVEDHIAPTALCKDVTVSLNGNGYGSLNAAGVNNNSYDNCGLASMSISQTQFSCSDVGNKTITLNMTDIHGNSSSCTSNVTTEVSGVLADGWASTDIGQVTMGNDYWYDACEQPPLYYVTGSGNNATGTTNDNVAFTSYNMCGDFTLTARIESVDPNGYGGLMVRENIDAGTRQTALFSNLSSMLRHEVRYATNGVKQVNSFFKPGAIWLRIQRQGDWIFSYSSYDGTNFQYVHAVFISLPNCVEAGMASFTYMPGSQTEVVFSNVSISGSNGSFGNSTTSPTNPITTSLTNPITTSHPNPITTSHPNLHLYPNPASTNFTVLLDRGLPDDAIVEVISLYGQTIAKQNMTEGQIYAEWNAAEWTPGTYWLRVNIPEAQPIVRKFLVVK